MIAAGLQDKGHDPLIQETCGRPPVLRGLCSHYFKSAEASLETAIANTIRAASGRSDKNVSQTAKDSLRQKIHTNFIESATLCTGVARDLGVKDPIEAGSSYRKQRDGLISAFFGPVDQEKYIKAAEFQNALNTAILKGEQLGIVLAEQSLKSYHSTTSEKSDEGITLPLKEILILSKDASFAAFFNKKGIAENVLQEEVFVFESGRKILVFVQSESGHYKFTGQCPDSMNRKACVDIFVFDRKELKEKVDRLARLESMYTKLTIAASFVPGGATANNLVEWSYGELDDISLIAFDAAADIATVFWIGAKTAKAGSKLRNLEDFALRTATYTNIASSKYGFQRLTDSIANSEDPSAILVEGSKYTASSALFWALYHAGTRGKFRLKEISLNKFVEDFASLPFQ